MDDVILIYVVYHYSSASAEGISGIQRISNVIELFVLLHTSYFFVRRTKLRGAELEIES